MERLLEAHGGAADPLIVLLLKQTDVRQPGNGTAEKEVCVETDAVTANIHHDGPRAEGHQSRAEMYERAGGTLDGLAQMLERAAEERSAKAKSGQRRAAKPMKSS